jgi:hypothetical protein
MGRPCLKEKRGEERTGEEEEKRGKERCEEKKDRKQN